MLAEGGIHRLGHKTICNAIAIRQIAGELFIESILNTTPWHAPMPECPEKAVIRSEDADGCDFASSQRLIANLSGLLTWTYRLLLA